MLRSFALLAFAVPALADPPLAFVGEPLPAGAVGRFGRPGVEEPRGPMAVGQLPGGAVRLAIADGRTVRVWAWQSVTSRRPVHELVGHSADVKHLAISGDGRVAVSADVGEVRAWDMISGESTVVATSKKPITALVVDRSARRIVLAVGSDVQLIDRPTDRRIKIGSHDRDVSALAIGVGGRLATADVRGRIAVWRADGTRLADLAWTPLVVEPAAEPRLPANLKPKGPLPSVIDYSDGVRKLAFSPDGTRLLAAGGTVVRLWDVASAKLIWQHNRHARVSLGLEFLSRNYVPPDAGPRQVGRANDIAFSPDGKLVASSGINGDSWIGHADHGETLRETKDRVPHFVDRAGLDSAVGVRFDPDGKTITLFDRSRQFVREEIRSGRQIAIAGGHRWGVTGLALTPDGRYLASYGDDGLIRFWRVATHECVSIRRGGTSSFHGVNDIAFSPDGKWFVTGGTFHGFDVFSVKGDPPRTSMKDNYDRVSYQSHVFTPGEPATLFAFFRERGLSRTLNLENRKESGPNIRVSDEPKSMAITPDGKMVAVAFGYSPTPMPKIFDPVTGKEALTLEEPSGYGLIDSVKYSPDGRTLAGRSRAALTLWDAATGRIVASLVYEGSEWGAFAFAPNGKTIAAAGSTPGVGENAIRKPGVIRNFDVATGKVLRTISAVPPVRSLLYHPDGTLFSGSADGAIYVWPGK